MNRLTSASAIGWGQDGDIPVVGDWNGDGRVEIGVFCKGVWYLDTDGSHKLAASRIRGWGQAGDVPILGDWNKGGKVKIGTYRSGKWLLDMLGTHQMAPTSQVTLGVK